jgi:hypothetical protein
MLSCNQRSINASGRPRRSLTLFGVGSLLVCIKIRKHVCHGDVQLISPCRNGSLGSIRIVK